MDSFKGNSASFCFNFFDVINKWKNYQQDKESEAQETVDSDNKRITSKEAIKEAFYINTEDAAMFEDFPCNPVGVSFIICNSIYSQC